MFIYDSYRKPKVEEVCSDRANRYGVGSAASKHGPSLINVKVGVRHPQRCADHLTQKVRGAMQAEYTEGRGANCFPLGIPGPHV